MKSPPARLAALAAFALLAVAGTLAAQGTRVVGRHDDWTTIAHDGASQICFAFARPQSSEPKGLNRDPAFFYVSAWPKEGVKTEVSIKMGYPLKKGAPANVAVGPETFALFSRDDRAFVADPTAELKLVEAMRKGSRMVVTATSERGTQTTDTYSLIGMSQALQTLAAGCQ